MLVADFDSPTWNRLEQWALLELDGLRKKNDNKTLSPEATASLRGEIDFCKKFIGLPETIRDMAARERAVPAPEEDF